LRKKPREGPERESAPCKKKGEKKSLLTFWGENCLANARKGVKNKDIKKGRMKRALSSGRRGEGGGDGRHSGKFAYQEERGLWELGGKAGLNQREKEGGTSICEETLGGGREKSRRN